MPSGQPDRERDRLDDRVPTAHDERAGCEKLAQAGGDPCRIARARLWQQELELIPAYTGDQAVAPDIGAEDPTDNAQDLVAGVVPMGVVNPL
jgi:hypothetical protein